ncbi:DUF3566 domain-containing protein [Cellulomonas sp. URHB0016]
MTDSTPPSIPPRKRPTTPVTAGRSTAARGGESSTGRTVTSSPNGTPSGSDSSGPASSSSVSSSSVSSSSVSSGSASSSSVSPGGLTSGGASSGASTKGRSDDGRAPVRPPTTGFDPPRTSTRDDRTSTSSTPGTTGTTGDDPEQPSPLMVAVDTATVWFKKAAGATSTAFAAVTRPRTEDPTMTTPATSAAAPPRTSARPAPATGAVPRTTTGRIPTVAGPNGGARRVRLAISRVDPWSVMKLSFLLSVAIGVMIVVAAAVVWLTLDGLHVFTKVNDLVVQIVGTESPIDILQYVEFKRIVSGATLIAVIDVFLLTALSTIGAFLYNIVAALVGGVHVTMTDE